MNNLVSKKNSVFSSLFGPSETGKSQFTYSWLKIATFQPNLTKFTFLHQHSQPHYDVMQTEIQNP